MDENNGVPLNDQDINALADRLQKEGRKAFGAAFPKGNLSAQVFPQAKPAAPVVVQPKTEDEERKEKIKNENLAVVEKENNKKENWSVIKPLRTYERDIAETIRTKDTSVASINLAEQKRKDDLGIPHQVAKTTERYSKNSILALVSILLILVGSGTILILYIINKNNTPVITPVEYSLITADNTVRVDIDSSNKNELINSLVDTMGNRGRAGSLTKIKIIENSTTAGVATEKEMDTSEFFGVVGHGAPQSLSRALGKDFMVGYYSTETNSEPFILLSVSSFENAYDGMLKWENNISSDLNNWFIKKTEPVGTSTEIFTTPNLNKNFEDLVVKNKDTRVLKDVRGNVAILYSFLSDKYLVITASDGSFKEVLGRFIASRFVR